MIIGFTKRSYDISDSISTTKWFFDLQWIILIDYDLCQIGIELGELNW